MKQKMICPLCEEDIYSGLGGGCKMCGMPLDDKSKDFCSKRCKVKYKRINKLVNINEKT